MNFRNPVWDGRRGRARDEYREYIPARDLAVYEEAAARMVAAVREVGSSRYTASQGFHLLSHIFGTYPTSATLKDYPYFRHFVTNANPRVMSMGVEIGARADGFRPEPDVARRVRSEGATLMTEFCLAIMCVGDAVLHATGVRTEAEDLRAFRANLAQVAAGSQYLERLEALGGELVPRLVDPATAAEATDLLGVALAWWRGERELDADAVRRSRRLLAQLRKGASPGLKAALDAAREDVARMEGRSAKEALKLLRAPPGALRTRQAPRKKRQPSDG